METTNANKQSFPLSLNRRSTRTDTGDSSTEVRQDGGTSVTHLTLDRELSLDVDLSNQSPDREGGNTGKKENRREDNDGNEFREHAYTHRENGIKVVRNRTVNCNYR